MPPESQDGRGASSWWPSSPGFFNQSAPPPIGFGLPTIPGIGDNANMFMQLLMMRVALANNIDLTGLRLRNVSPVEGMLGMSYMQQRQIAMDSRIDQRALEDGFYRIGAAAMGPGAADAARQKGDYSKLAAGLAGNPFIMQAISMTPLANYMPMGVGRGVFEGMRGMAGASIFNLPEMANVARTVSAQWQSPLSFKDRGGLAEGLGAMGLLPGRIDDIDVKTTTQQAANRLRQTLQNYEGLVAQLKDIFGRDKGIPKLLQELDEATQGGLRAMSATSIQQLATRIQTTALMTGMPKTDITAMMGYGGQAARGYGLHPTIGAQRSLEALGIASMIGQNQSGYTGYGIRSPGEIAGIVQKSLLSGGASTVSQLTGGFMDLIRMSAANRGLSNWQSRSPADLLRSMGGSSSMSDLLKRMELGTASPDAVLRTFASENMGGLLSEARRIGYSGVSAQSILQAYSADAQGLAAQYVNPMTILSAQQASIMNTVVRPNVMRVLRGGMGARRANDLFGRLTQMVTEGAFETPDEQVNQGLIRQRLGVSDPMAQNIWAVMKGALEGSVTLRGRGGANVVLPLMSGARAYNERQQMYESIVGASNVISTKLGTQGFVANLLTDFMLPMTEGREKEGLGGALKRYLNSPSTEDTKVLTDIWNLSREMSKQISISERGTPQERARARKRVDQLKKQLQDEYGKLTPEYVKGLEGRLAEGPEGAAKAVMNATNVVIKTDKVNIESGSNINTAAVKEETTQIVDKSTGASGGTSTGRGVVSEIRP